MKDGLRFVDCDMHIMEPPDLFANYLDPQFKDRVIIPVGADGKPCRGPLVIDGQPTTMDVELQKYRKPSHSNSPHSSQPLSGSRSCASRTCNGAVEAEPSISRGSRPASSQARRIA